MRVKVGDKWKQKSCHSKVATITYVDKNYVEFSGYWLQSGKANKARSAFLNHYVLQEHYTEIGADVYRIALARCDDGSNRERLRAGAEVVRLQDYQIALERIMELEGKLKDQKPLTES